MSRWFRHYAGMCRDEKLVSVAIKSKQPIERVVWIYSAILESASEVDDGGRYAVDPAEMAYFLRTDESDIVAILAALEGAGRLDNNCVAKWGNRQFSSDRSKDRVAAFRERKRAEIAPSVDAETSHNVDVTLLKRHCNSPETETELDTETDISSLRSDSALVRAEPAKAISDRKPKEPKAKRASRIPEGFDPGSAGLDYAESQGLTLDDVLVEQEKFRDYHASKGSLMLDWDAAWRTWVRNAVEFRARAGPKALPPRQAPFYRS